MYLQPKAFDVPPGELDTSWLISSTCGVHVQQLEHSVSCIVDMRYMRTSYYVIWIVIGSRLLADNGVNRTVTQLRDTAIHWVHFLDSIVN